jgi:uncharacterized protein (UPF0548 family)
LSRLRRPTEEEITKHLASADHPFSYAEVGSTKGVGPSLPSPLATTYDIDRHEFRLGTGRKLFENAREALIAWRHFEIPWLELYGASTTAKTGQVVATLVSVAGLWFFNPCRVVYTEAQAQSGNMVAFAYGTLQGHVECGEERFQVSFDPASEAVTYEILAFSRPAVLLSKLGYPIVRVLQKRFAKSSAAALARAAA